MTTTDTKILGSKTRKVLTARDIFICFASHGLPEQVATALQVSPNITGQMSLDEAASYLDESFDGQLLVLYETASERAASPKSRNEPFSAELDRWLPVAETLAEIISAKREQIVLANVRQTLFYPELFCAQFGFGDAARVALEEFDPDPPDFVTQVLADAFVQHHRVTRRLDDWLRASALDLSEGPVDPLEEIARAREVHAQTLSRVERAEMLQGDLKQAKCRAEEIQTDLGEVRTKLARLEIERVAEREALAKKEAEISRLAAENTELGHLQAEAEQGLKFEREAFAKKEAEIARLVNQNTELDHRRTEAERWLEGIFASRSYRIMAPLRKLRAITMRRQ